MRKCIKMGDNKEIIINDKEKISYICKNKIIGNNHEYRSREFRYFKRISKKIAN